MRVAVVYSEPCASAPEEHWIRRSDANAPIAKEAFHDASEHGFLDEVRLIARFLSEGGFSPVLFAANDPAKLGDFLAREKPDAIFNCCESFRGNPALEMNVAAVYELFGIPFTGSSALSLAVALNKPVAKALLRANGVPTPDYLVIDSDSSGNGARSLRPPWIVKPVAEDASIGIDRNSVVHDETALAKRVRFVLEQFRQPALVEEYIEGRELNVALLASSPTEFAALPISEFVLDGLPDDWPRILGYEAKWLTHSDAYRATVTRCPARLQAAVAKQVRAVALKAARVIGLRDYGRIDLRLRSGDNAIFVLEANPNPDITYDSGFIRAAQATGRTHAGTVREILERALERYSMDSQRAPAPRRHSRRA